ncbi:hypothetical protein HHI36_002053 [Cryptolaemus montrouzieri]|uniref:Uncharacterized protein n=1 Tax=Cryptolaemus montrouzieri TaxID=559131 RepID=A0ABD2P9B1_9CUCU
MEELNSKLLSKDSSVIALVISKIVQHIEEEHVQGKKDLLEPSFLIIKCVNTDPQTNEVASLGIIKLLEQGIISPDKLLEEFITLIPSSKITRGIVKAINAVLCYQFAHNSKKDNIIFNIVLPQHPFITLLMRDPDCLPYIYNEIRYFHRAKDWSSSWNYLNYSFYQFCICNPTNKKPSFYKMKLWLNLLETSKNIELITKLVSWMLFDCTGSISVTSELINELSIYCWRNGDKIDIQILLMLQVSVLYHLVSKGYDPRNTLENIELMMSKMPIIDFTNPILLILVKTIIRCSSVYVLEILQICKFTLFLNKI